MFVEIKEHEDVFYSPCCDEHILDMTRPIKFSANYLQNINLNQVNQIYFGVLDSSKKPNPEYWEIINGYKYISFLIRTDKKKDYDFYSLYFGKSAMGEYHRIKRIIDDNILK